MDLGFHFLSLWRTPQFTAPTCTLTSAFSAQKHSTNVSWTVAILCSGGGQNSVGVCSAIKMQFIEVGKNDMWAWKIISTLSSLRFYYVKCCSSSTSLFRKLHFLALDFGILWIFYASWKQLCISESVIVILQISVPTVLLLFVLRRDPIEETTSLLPKEKWISYCSFEDAGIDHLWQQQFPSNSFVTDMKLCSLMSCTL